MADITLCAVLSADAVPGLTRAFAADAAVFAVAEAGLCAVLWRMPKPIFGASRRDIAELLVRAQQILEAAQKAGPILAAAAGQRFPSEAEARAFLQVNAPMLAQALEVHGGLRQQQVTIRWDPPSAIMRFRERPAVGEALEAVQRERTRAAGEALQAAMEGLKAELAAGFHAELKTAAAEILELPIEGPDVLMSVAVAIAPGGEGAFEAALARIDAVWTEGLQIKCVGPLPAISFAAVTIDRVGDERLAEARNRLGVAAGASSEEVEQAFRAVVKASHPDVGGQADGAEANAILEARDLLVRMASLMRQAAPQQAAGHIAQAGIAKLQRDGVAQRAA